MIDIFTKLKKNTPKPSTGSLKVNNDFGWVFLYIYVYIYNMRRNEH